MPKKTGICLNVGGNCSLAKNKEIQTADVTHFKCSECGRDLISKTPPPPPPLQYSWYSLAFSSSEVRQVSTSGSARHPAQPWNRSD